MAVCVCLVYIGLIPTSNILNWFDTNILKPVRMRNKYKDVNVRHENKSKSLILLYYSVSLMMAFTKKKSLNRITMPFACDTVMKHSSTKI